MRRVGRLALLCCLLPVLASAKDRQAPTVRITTPTSSTTMTTTSPSLTIGGTAADNERVTRVTWRTDRGASGTAQGTTTWMASIALVVGQTRITVTAVDPAGNTGQDVLTVTRTAPPSTLVARFEVDPESGTAPLAVEFTDVSTGSPTAWAWTFGDGATASTQHPRHTYATAGSYTVSLTIRNAAGASNLVTRVNAIVVSAGPPPPPGPITVDWQYAGTTGDAFQMERCVPVGASCPMASIATLPLTTRTWIDTAVAPTSRYCYRMAVTMQGLLGGYSNTLCSP